ncbi:MAG: long-chain fatty acid--CoA ligase [Phototrophicales bacterium]|nr:MAG: long-chain fatty acid--CoA ligase [Phototrophicales bacterium]
MIILIILVVLIAIYAIWAYQRHQKEEAEFQRIRREIDSIFLERSPEDPVGKIAPHSNTIPKNLLRSAKLFGNQYVAMRKKRYGIWQEYTWQESLQHVRNFCLGLVSLGLERNHKVCIVGDNDPEYYWAEMAVQSAGGVTIGIFTDASPRELEYLINDSDAVFVVAQDQEQVDNLLSIRDKIPNIKHVVYWDEQSLQGYDDPWLLSFTKVQALGEKYHEEHPTAFEEMIMQGDGEDIAIFSYTSGTTSLPKGAMIRHRNLMYGSLHASQIAPISHRDDYVSFSPLAWITEQSLGLTRHVVDGMVVNFPEKAETVQNDIREIAPVILLFPSRLWESLVSMVQARMVDAPWINRALYRYFLGIGYRIADYENERKALPLLLRFQRWLGEIALFAALRDKMGLSRLRFGYTSGASLSPDVLRFFRAINVELYQLYGSTECQGHTAHYPNDVRLGTVGRPLPTVDVKIADNGEILVKSRSVFAGYYKKENKTAEAFTPDGYFRTGDAGYINEEGHLVYLDRMKDMIQLANGESFSPQYIEGRLKFSPYIQDAMAVGGFDMPYVSVLITLNFDNVARWAEKRGISFTTLADLSQKPQVAELILQDIQRVNHDMPPAGHIRRFVILPRVFDPDEEELTRTRKLRRGYMEKKYGDVLDAIYSNKSTVLMRAEVRYRDGRVGYTETEVNIITVGDPATLPAVDPSSLALPDTN